MRSNRIGIVAAAWILSLSTQAFSYCRTTTCDPLRSDCGAADRNGCITTGLPLYWPSKCVSFVVQKDAAPGISFDTFNEITERSFRHWETVDCGDGSTPSLKIINHGAASCDKPEFNQDTGNANIVMFRTDAWDYQDTANVLAITTVTFGVESGIIYDADIEINAVDNIISVSDTNVTKDLESIVTHEAGHFLGLAHSNDHQATMYASYTPGTTTLRSLEPDDIAGICTIYPPTRTADCERNPYKGLRRSCASSGSDSDDGGCSIASLATPRAPGTSRTSGVLVVLLVALAAFASRQLGRRLRANRARS